MAGVFLTQILVGLLTAAPAATLAAAPIAAPAGGGEVVVTAPRRKDVPETVKAFAAPLSGDRLARWRTGLCPVVAGVEPAQAEAIRSRIIAIARAAKIAASPPKCQRDETNLLVVISSHDHDDRLKIAAHANTLLGQGQWPADKAQLSTFVKDDGKPVHVFYDIVPVSDRGAGQALDDVNGSSASAAADANNNLGFTAAPIVKGSPSRLAPNVDPAFKRVVIVVDGTKALGVTVTQMSAYLAMAALAEVKLDAPLAHVQTVTRLFADRAAERPPAEDLTFWDRAYLGALYGGVTQTSLTLQRSAMEQRIERSIDVLETSEPEAPRP